MEQYAEARRILDSDMVQALNILIRTVLIAAVAALPLGACVCGPASAQSLAATSTTTDHGCCAAAQDDTNSQTTPADPGCPRCEGGVLLATDCGDLAAGPVAFDASPSWPVVAPTHSPLFTWMPTPESPSVLGTPLDPPSPRSSATLQSLRCLSLT